MIDLNKVYDLEVDGIDTRDCPDFVDAYISDGSYENRKLTESEMDWITEEHPDLVYELVYKRLY